MIKAAAGLVQLTSEEIGHGIVGIEADRLTEVSQRVIDVAAVLVELASRAVSPGVLRIEPDGFVEVGQGVVEVSLVQVNVAAIDIGSSETGIDPDGFVPIRQRVIRVLFGPPPSTAVAECNRTAWPFYFGIVERAIAGCDVPICIVDLADELALCKFASAVGE